MRKALSVKAIEALRLVDEGIDPAACRRTLGMNVESICVDFIRQYARPRNRSWKEAEHILQHEFLAIHGQRDIREIKRHDIIEHFIAAALLAGNGLVEIKTNQRG